jgi:2-polyprenyl-3-methyl-5-hydroxy-6-metoxy-1,4-benzoquinol methylase
MAAAADRGLEELERLHGSVFPPEPPRRTRAVEAIVRLSRWRGDTAFVTPHLHHGSDRAKVDLEYGEADTFWEVFAGAATGATLRDKDVLDLGCGWGGKAIAYAERCAPASIEGFDLPGAMNPEVPTRVAAERGLTSVAFTTGYAEDVPFGDTRFDIVIMDDVLEHVADPPKVLAECFRVLRSGGLVLARFPSIRMARAHHLDRAIGWPGLHYVVPLRTWAAGLNQWLLDSGERFEPFDEVVDTPYRRGVPRNLNGMDLSAFEAVVRGSGLVTRHLELVPLGLSGHGPAARSVYRALRRVPVLREPLSQTIAFVGVRP